MEQIEKANQLFVARVGFNSYHDRDELVSFQKSSIGCDFQFFNLAKFREVGQPLQIKSLCIQSVGSLRFSRIRGKTGKSRRLESFTGASERQQLVLFFRHGLLQQT